jgi:CheY-like chemotaxis protein/HPt (histidine-containing phosphotransfer) domain-containing protein
LRQIITNLVGNAIKFTDNGSISLHIRRDMEDEQHVTLHFLLRDSGIGVAADKLDTIFETFIQADGSSTRKYGGTGLGLTISRQLAELMGGTVGVESVEGEGATFWFTVVLEKQTNKASSPDGITQNAGLKRLGACEAAASARLLLVEDDPTTQLVTKSILLKSGYQMDVASNGSEALKLLEENDYALVLMDCMMPGMNGYEVTAMVRDQTSNVRNHAIPIIALTANAFKEDRDTCLEAGMDDYLPKPIEIAELLAMLEKWVSSGSGRDGKSLVSIEPCIYTPDIFDMNEFVRRNQGDLELSHDVAAIFIDSAPEYIESINKAVAENDAVALRQSAHKLKGSAANLALALLSETARMIESDAKAGDFEKAGKLLPELELRFEQAVMAIRELLISPQGKD